jgi:hypothetical protein
MKTKPITREKLSKIKLARENKIISEVNALLEDFANSLLEGLTVEIRLSNFSKASIEFVIKIFGEDDSWTVQRPDEKDKSLLLFTLK